MDTSMTSSDGAIFSMDCDRRCSYSVVVADHVLECTASPLHRLLRGRRALAVTTPTVHAFYRQALDDFCRWGDIDLLVLDVSEETKTLATAERICQRALALGLDRRAMLVSIGGGVCSDLCSVAASLIRRGIGCIRVPTTLIGQIDAALGVKGGVNFEGRKSYLGCFTAPALVVLDPTFLRTLQRCDFQRGLAEIIKIGLVRDEGLFELVESAWREFIDTRGRTPTSRLIIERAALRMLEELQGNPFEDKTYERLVDAGHTFSPRIEAASGFSIHHGEAVAIDLCLSATIAAEAGLMSWNARDRVVNLIDAIGLPAFTPVANAALCAAALTEAARHRGGHTDLVLPRRIGEAVFVKSECDLQPHVVPAAIERLEVDASARYVAAGSGAAARA